MTYIRLRRRHANRLACTRADESGCICQSLKCKFINDSLEHRKLFHVPVLSTASYLVFEYVYVAWLLTKTHDNILCLLLLGVLSCLPTMNAMHRFAR